MGHRNMATDLDIESVLSTSDTFCKPPTISHTATAEEISRFITEHTDSGVPCIITDFPHTEGDTQSPFICSAEWLESFYRPHGMLYSFFAHFLWNSSPVHRINSPVSPRMGSLVT